MRNWLLQNWRTLVLLAALLVGATIILFNFDPWGGREFWGREYLPRIQVVVPRTTPALGVVTACPPEESCILARVYVPAGTYTNPESRVVKNIECGGCVRYEEYLRLSTTTDAERFVRVEDLVRERVRIIRNEPGAFRIVRMSATEWLALDEKEREGWSLTLLGWALAAAIAAMLGYALWIAHGLLMAQPAVPAGGTTP